MEKPENTEVGTIKKRTATRTITIAAGQSECTRATEMATQVREVVNAFFRKIPEPGDINTLKNLLGDRMGTEE